MKLQDYFEKEKIKPTPWAFKNNIAPSVISRFLNGSGISKENALKIERATGGAVTVMELLFPAENKDPESKPLVTRRG